MSKLKLNIQKFSSTNKTTHYDLSQYIASDKPTYLIDYNQDMAKIDAGIYGAMSKASVNEANIGTMSNLNTSEKTNLVGAINEVNTQVESNSSNIEQNTQDISANNTKIGTLADLSTIYKTNLVGAINEVKTDTKTNKDSIDKFNLVNYKTFTTSEISSSNVSSISGDVKVATNSDGSIFKIYTSNLSAVLTANNGSLTFNTDIRPTENITINGAGTSINEVNGDRTPVAISGFDIDINTNGVVTIALAKYQTADLVRLIINPCIYFAKNFGDTPTDI